MFVFLHTKFKCLIFIFGRLLNDSASQTYKHTHSILVHCILRLAIQFLEFGLNGNITSESICGVFFCICVIFNRLLKSIESSAPKTCETFVTIHNHAYTIYFAVFKYYSMHCSTRSQRNQLSEQMNLQIRILFKLTAIELLNLHYFWLFDRIFSFFSPFHNTYTVRSVIVDIKLCILFAY